MPVISLCTKGIQDSLGFWISRCGFQIPGTGFQYLSVEQRDYDLFSLGKTWIPDFNGYYDSGFLEQCSGFQNPGFRVPIKLPLKGGHERIKLQLYRFILSCRGLLLVSILNSCLEYPLECTLLALQAQRLFSSFQFLVQRVYFGSWRPGRFSTSVFFIFAEKNWEGTPIQVCAAENKVLSIKQDIEFYY